MDSYLELREAANVGDIGSLTLLWTIDRAASAELRGLGVLTADMFSSRASTISQMICEKLLADDWDSNPEARVKVLIG